ncbi:site-specific DNA-methyltransferase [Candidatus Roizmanbacteria bacterium]|nr:MAG: site-specific DNA-methyltransferase [Candidatus Roizmanbacteria bacterium]
MNNLLVKKPENLIKYGDMFEMNGHYLINGDATDLSIINKILNNVKISAIISDPPYAIDYVASKANFQNVSKPKDILTDHFQTDTEYSEFTYKWLSLALPFMNIPNSIYIFNSDKMIFALRDGMIQAGVKLSQLLIWVKNNSVVGRLDYCPKHELIAYGWYGSHRFRKSKDQSVLFFPKPNRSTLHPTMKPISLMRHLILNSSNINDIIYDPFGGSGSTLLAAEQTKRKCVMIELDPEYCQVIIDRWEKLTGLRVKKIYG